MKSKDPEYILLELKYCERCGGLWLRVQGDPGPYCAPCDLELMDSPRPRRRLGRPRLPGNHYSDSALRGTSVAKPAAKKGDPYANAE